MAEQEHAQSQQAEVAQTTTEVTDEATAQDAAVAEVTERHATLSDDVDALLDEIDDVLEVNAEDFVKSFVQKGGQ
jgi:ubiquitin-like protein Pup